MYIRNIDDIFCNIKEQVNDVNECQHSKPWSAQTLLNNSLFQLGALLCDTHTSSRALRSETRLRILFLNAALKC